MAPLGYTEESTARASDSAAVQFPSPAHAYDEKDDMDSLKAQLQRRKKPIIAGLALLCVVVVGLSIGLGVSGGSETATTQSAEDTASSSGSASHSAVGDSNVVGSVSAGNDDADTGSASASASASGSAGWGSASASDSSDSVAGEAGLGSSSGWSLSSNGSAASSASQSAATDAPSAAPAATDTSTPTPTPSASASASSDGEVLGYSIVDFDWTDASNWEYASGGSVSSSMVTSSGITLTPDNSDEPIRTITGWSGEKIVYIEWERTSTSDTNIWMLNTKLEDQFASNNGWPYWGEIDLFEMFTQDAITYPAYDFSGFGSFSSVSSYGQLTMHMGPATANGDPCYCPSSASKSSWYQNTEPMTSGCTAQFSNDASNSIAAVWGTDGTGQYIQLIQKPTITKGGKLNGVDTYDITTGSGGVTSKIYNNADLFWGVDASDSCASAGGHNADTGFPFFESFRIILEEQKKGDSSASFTVTDIKIFTPN